MLHTDCPSRASEFAHCDVLIGLTVLAYRYEGLRECDFEEDVLQYLRSEFDKGAGAFHACVLLYRTRDTAAFRLGMTGS